MTIWPQELIDRICARTVEVGDCLEWHGAMNNSRAMYVSWQWKKLGVRRVLWENLHGPIPPKRQLVCTCGNDRCVRHLEPMTISQKNKRIAKEGKFSTPAQRARVAAGRRKNSKLSDEAVNEIRLFDGYVPDVAAQYGITPSYAYMIRRGTSRQDFSNPWAGLGA